MRRRKQDPAYAIRHADGTVNVLVNSRTYAMASQVLRNAQEADPKAELGRWDGKAFVPLAKRATS